MTILLFALAFSSHVLADDDAWEIDIDSIDIGGADAKGQELVTYTGASDQNAPGYKAGAPVTITHTAGTISVQCMDRDGISARIDYMLEGTNRNAMSSFGKGVGISAWGSASSGGVKTRIPGASSTIKSKALPLSVSLPRDAKVRVNGGNGWIQVQGCHGTVSASNRAGDIMIEGTLSNVNASAPKGTIRVLLDESSSLTGTNRITASGGDVELHLPTGYGGRIYAKGSQVDVRHMIDGTESPTLVQGSIGEGRASLSVTARGKINVRTPE